MTAQIEQTDTAARAAARFAAAHEEQVQWAGRACVPAVHLAGWVTVTYRPPRHLPVTAVIVEEHAKQTQAKAADAVVVIRKAFDDAAKTGWLDPDLGASAAAAVTAVKEACFQTWECAGDLAEATAEYHCFSFLRPIERWEQATGLRYGEPAPAGYVLPPLSASFGSASGRFRTLMSGVGRAARVLLWGDALDDAHAGIVDVLLDALLDPDQPSHGFEAVTEAAVTYQRARVGSEDEDAGEAYAGLLDAIDAPTQISLSPHDAHAAAQLMSGHAAMAWAAQQLAK